jgi:predicted CXXCH cytochrome family protein
MPSPELALFLAAATMALVALSLRTSAVRAPLAVAAGLAVVVSALSTLAAPAAGDFEARGYIPRRPERSEYVSSSACRKCHASEHQAWHASFHRTMTQVVTPDTVLAAFDGREETLDGVRHRFFRRGEAYLVEEYDEALDARVTRRVVLSTGTRRYQVYWLESGLDTEPLECLLYWSVDAQRFVPKQDTILTPPDIPVERGEWNNHCIRCHSVGGKPGYRSKTQGYRTEVAEFGVGCEACHGPGRAHAEALENPLLRYAAHGSERRSDTVNPARLDAHAASEVCGRCHGAFGMNLDRYARQGFGYLPGGSLESEVTFHAAGAVTPGGAGYADAYWSDGSVRVGGDEYNALRRSACFTKGALGCTSCHSMHDTTAPHGTSVTLNNDACLSCHGQMKPDVSAHTHHAASSSGSLCYNCHMPHRTWALSTAMRDHEIESPRTADYRPNTKPNACNLCHLDKTSAWTSGHLAAWYGMKTESASEPEPVAEAVRLLVAGNAMQRAVTAWHMAWPPALVASGRGWQAPLVAELLDDPYAQVRFVAGQTLLRLGAPAPGYDFLASSAERRAARAAFAPSSTVPEALLAKLRQRRDDTRITIPE